MAEGLTPESGAGIAPESVHTLSELAAALNGLRQGRSYAELGRAARPDRLPASTLNGLLRGKTLPAMETLEVYLRACGVTTTAEKVAWRAARERAMTARPPLAGAVRVAQAQPRLLGVHKAIDVPGADGSLPAYVERDTDTEPGGVRARLSVAMQGGGLVVLVGGSSVGKTRCAFEAVSALMPQWWLIYPRDAAQLRELAAAPVVRTVVWLDELQHYFHPEHGLDTVTVRALLTAGTVLVATVWPERYTAYTTPPRPGAPDSHWKERQVLDLAEVVHLRSRFSSAEIDRARQAADGDPRIRLALQSSDYGLTQVIAAAPQLIDRWKSADAYAGAVLTAAIDLTRLGVRAPLSAELLRAAAPGYCDRRQRAAAPANWFETAMAYASELLHGAAAALAPVAVEMGQPSGYALADYLLQHAGRERRTAIVPAAMWRAVLTHLDDLNDQTRLADRAQDRLLYCYADPLYRKAAEAGDDYGARRLVGLLAKRGEVGELRVRAEAGDDYAAVRLASVLVERGEVEEALNLLRVRAEAGDTFAAGQMASLLIERGEVEEALNLLRVRAKAGDDSAAGRLVGLLVERGEVGELRVRAEAGDTFAAVRLAGLLAKRKEVGELRVRAEAGDAYAAVRLASVLAERGEVEEALNLLRVRAEAGNDSAAGQLADLLVERGEVGELRVRAEAGDTYAANRLAALLAKRGEVGELRVRAEAGDTYAANRLAALLAKRKEAEELRVRAEAGDTDAAWELARALQNAGCQEEADRVRRSGLSPQDY